ncbi:MAG: hypothetical protein M3O70_02255 [Actinomycetota bacterium]|nr:hypothetical protein [Actinomycetota bacterium]
MPADRGSIPSAPNAPPYAEPPKRRVGPGPIALGPKIGEDLQCFLEIRDRVRRAPRRRKKPGGLFAAQREIQRPSLVTRGRNRLLPKQRVVLGQ